jgi:hypothetical protein
MRKKQGRIHATGIKNTKGHQQKTRKSTNISSRHEGQATTSKTTSEPGGENLVHEAAEGEVGADASWDIDNTCANKKTFEKTM